MLHGDTNKTGGLPYVGNVPGNTRLNIPPLTLNDGPQGFRDNASPGTTTAWPSGLTMAASFDKDIMFEVSGDPPSSHSLTALCSV